MMKERVILSPVEYRKLRWQKYREQNGRCAYCGNGMSFAEMELHHKTVRGMGGSHRADTVENTEGNHRRCHGKAKNRSKFGR
jgi:5-methylcytosine-specific restriction endonuclease McrA